MMNVKNVFTRQCVSALNGETLHNKNTVLTQGEPSSVPYPDSVTHLEQENLNKDFQYIKKSASGEKIKSMMSAEVASTATH